jgi:mono/diheme cytochrome c family protein
MSFLYRNPSLPALPGMSVYEDVEERTDISRMHAILREKADPVEGREPVSLWMVALMCAMFAWGGFYVGRYNGGFKPLVFSETSSGQPSGYAAPAAVDPRVLGKRVFAANCQPCHQENGLGLPGQFPPLAASEWVLASGHSRLVRLVLDGIQGPIEVKGQSYNGAMPPWRDVLNDEQTAAVLTYIRSEWGNQAEAVKPDQVKAIRDKTKDRPAQGAWSAAELLALPEQE